MRFTAYQIKTLLNGTVEGNPDVVVGRLAKIEEAQAGSLSFLANPRYERHLYSTNASVVIIRDDYLLTQAVKATLIRVKDPYTSFSILLEKYNSAKLDKQGIEDLSFVHPTAVIGKNVYVGAFAYIGQNAVIGDRSKIYPQVYVGDDVKIGHECTLFAGVKIYSDCLLGDRVLIHSNTVIGSDGFGFVPQKDGSYNKISQIGHVIIEDDVEIGANSAVDRATMGSTIIRQGVKLDNLIQIAHNVEVGAHTVIAAQSGIAGSAKIGSNSAIGGQVGIVGHITVAKGSQIQAKSGVNCSIEVEGKRWAGAPAISYISHMKSQVIFQRLPELEKEIKELRNMLYVLNQRKKE